MHCRAVDVVGADEVDLVVFDHRDQYTVESDALAKHCFQTREFYLFEHETDLYGLRAII